MGNNASARVNTPYQRVSTYFMMLRTLLRCAEGWKCLVFAFGEIMRSAFWRLLVLSTLLSPSLPYFPLQIMIWSDPNAILPVQSLY